MGLCGRSNGDLAEKARSQLRLDLRPSLSVGPGAPSAAREPRPH